MKIFIFIFIFIPFISFSQLIERNQTDSFTHQKRIVTKSISVTAAFSFASGVDQISYHTINNKIFIVLHGENEINANTCTILQDDIGLLITEKDTIVIKSAGLQNSYGRYSPMNFNDEYLIDKKDVTKLSKNKLLSVRRYTSGGIFDLFIKEKFQSNLMQLSDALLKEMNK